MKKKGHWLKILLEGVILIALAAPPLQLAQAKATLPEQAVQDVLLDVGDILVSTSAGTTSEGGASVIITFTLGSVPSEDVTINLSSDNTAEGQLSADLVVLNAANFATGAAVMVTGQNDAIADGDQTYHIVTSASVSSDPNYDGKDVPDVTLINIDNDHAGYVLTNTNALTTSEAHATATFGVALTSQPSNPVSISVSSNNASEGTVTSPGGGQLSFNSGNWNVAQNVTVTGQDDLVDDGNVAYTVTVGPGVGASEYAAITATVNLTNTDNDTAGYTIQVSDATSSESAGTAAFSVALLSQPSNPVTIALTSNDTSEGRVTSPSPAQLNFTAGDWMNPQAVTVTGQDDFVDDGNVAYTITVGPGSGASEYAGITQAVNLTNTDNDTAGYLVNGAAGLTTSEPNGTGTFSVALQSQPSNAVSINLVSSNTAEARITTPSSGHLDFTGSNWNSPQNVVVTGQDDYVADGPVPYTITVGPGSGASEYSSLSYVINATNNDNDVAGFEIIGATGLITSENQTSASFEVKLTSQPSAPLSILVYSNDLTEGRVTTPDGGHLTFTSANWDQPQSVVVTGENDFFADGDIDYTVTVGPGIGANEYLNQTAIVHLTNTDNDTAGFTLTGTSSLSTSEAGGSATFQVALSSRPSADVSLPVTSSDTGEGVITAPASGTLTFTDSNWDIPQNVTVKGVNDIENDGTAAYVVTVGPASGASEYIHVVPMQVAVENLDNEIAWVNPVGNRETYVISHGTITLQATPSDSVDPNDLAYVWYARYDPSLPPPLDNQFVGIGSSSSPPYAVPLYVDDLDLGYTQIFVFYYDKEGNRSAYNPQNGINIYKASASIYLPVVHK